MDHTVAAKKKSDYRGGGSRPFVDEKHGDNVADSKKINKVWLLISDSSVFADVQAFQKSYNQIHIRNH